MVWACRFDFLANQPILTSTFSQQMIYGGSTSLDKVSIINIHPHVQIVALQLRRKPETGYSVVVEKCLLMSELVFI